MRAEAACLKLDVVRDVFLIRTEDEQGNTLLTVTNPHKVNDIYGDALERLLHAISAMFVKEPYVEGSYLITKPALKGLDVPLHQDAALSAYRSSTRGRRISAWLPLQDTDNFNGGLVIYPRSHLGGLFGHETIKRSMGFAQKRIPLSKLQDLGPPIFAICKCGGFLLLDDKLFMALREVNIRARAMHTSSILSFRSSDGGAVVARFTKRALIRLAAPGRFGPASSSFSLASAEGLVSHSLNPSAPAAARPAP